ncbi:division plane positioning ATPase MipZ [Halomonas sp. AOP43-A1-21]
MILVINTKGGSGKSTASMQLLAPWVLSRTGKAAVVELDDENHDSADYTDSAIQSERVMVGKEVDAEYAIDELVDRTDDNFVIADIGGNRTSAMALQHIGARGYDAFINLIVIPVSGPGQDVKNAQKTLDHVRNLMPDYEGPVLMVMTRTTTTDVRSVRRRMPDAFHLLAKEKLAGPIILPTDNSFPMSRMLKMSVWEIGQQGDELKKQLRAAMGKARQNPEKREELALLNSVVSDSLVMHEYLEQQFGELDKVLDLRAALRAGGDAEEDAPAAKASSKAKASA